MRVLIITAALLVAPSAAAAQLNPDVVCGLPVPKPSQSPPEGSGPMAVAVLLCFDKQGGVASIEPQTYLYYIQFRASEPSRGRWVAYDAEAERMLLADFRRLWETNFLDDLSIEMLDYRFDNGAPGKLIVFHLEERRRLKIVDYEGLTRITRSDITDRLKERGIDLRLDSFVDDGQLRRVTAVTKELYAEKGYRDAHVAAAIRALDGGPKIARVIFTIAEGPKIAIRDVEFIGNRAFNDDVLAGRLKANKARGLLTLVSGGGAFHEEKFADDAQAIVEHYRNHGYIEAQIGAPQVRPLDDSADGATRWVQLRIDVNEGRRFQVGTLNIDGNTVVRTEALLPLFKMDEGDVYDEQRIRRGLERARELYGSGGYFEFTAYPDLKPRDAAPVPTVDVTLRVSEGKQYFIGRIEFAGNTHTRDTVIRREIGLVEGGVFNTEALKYSVKRINQLGYFKPIDEKALAVDRAPGAEDKVNVKVTV
ncbi:MAG: BamA/OMP85 family outer membrane protein, partial [Vicinamibacterales bacterium]